MMKKGGCKSKGEEQAREAIRQRSSQLTSPESLPSKHVQA
jgi:hypothetical protein